MDCQSCVQKLVFFDNIWHIDICMRYIIILNLLERVCIADPGFQTADFAVPVWFVPQTAALIKLVAYSGQ